MPNFPCSFFSSISQFALSVLLLFVWFVSSLWLGRVLLQARKVGARSGKIQQKSGHSRRLAHWYDANPHQHLLRNQRLAGGGCAQKARGDQHRNRLSGELILLFFCDDCFNDRRVLGSNPASTNLLQKDRFQNLSTMAKFLADQNYHDKEAISRKNQGIQAKWQHFCELLERRKANSSRLSDITSMFREIESIQQELKQLEVSQNDKNT